MTKQKNSKVTDGQSPRRGGRGSGRQSQGRGTPGRGSYSAAVEALAAPGFGRGGGINPPTASYPAMSQPSPWATQLGGSADRAASTAGAGGSRSHAPQAADPNLTEGLRAITSALADVAARLERLERGPQTGTPGPAIAGPGASSGALVPAGTRPADAGLGTSSGDPLRVPSGQGSQTHCLRGESARVAHVVNPAGSGSLGTLRRTLRTKRNQLKTTTDPARRVVLAQSLDRLADRIEQAGYAGPDRSDWANLLPEPEQESEEEEAKQEADGTGLPAGGDPDLGNQKKPPGDLDQID